MAFKVLDERILCSPTITSSFCIATSSGPGDGDWRLELRAIRHGSRAANRSLRALGCDSFDLQDGRVADTADELLATPQTGSFGR
jgi:hypothetical protein